MHLSPPPYIHDDFFTNVFKRSGPRMRTWFGGEIHRDFFNDTASFTSALPAVTDQASAPGTVGNSALYALTAKSIYMTFMFIIVGATLLLGSRILRRPRVVQPSPVRSAGPIRISRDHPEVQPGGLRRRFREVQSEEFLDRDYGRQITDDEWDDNLNLGTDGLQGHVLEHSDADSFKETENGATKRFFKDWEGSAEQGDTRKSWFSRFRELRRRNKASDTGRSSAVPDAHGSRGQGVYDLEQLKTTISSQGPGQNGRKEDAANGVLLEDPVNVGNSHPEHAVDLVPIDHKGELNLARH